MREQTSTDVSKIFHGLQLSQPCHGHTFAEGKVAPPCPSTGKATSQCLHIQCFSEHNRSFAGINPATCLFPGLISHAKHQACVNYMIYWAVFLFSLHHKKRLVLVNFHLFVNGLQIVNSKHILLAKRDRKVQIIALFVLFYS